MDIFTEDTNTDPIDQIKELTAKKEQAQLLLARYSAQLENLVQERDELVKKLETEHGTTLEGAEARLSQLKDQRDKLLEEAKNALSRIKL